MREIVLYLRAVMDQRPMKQMSYAFFSYDPELFPEHPHDKYEMDIEEWEAMGRPRQITMRVDPGNMVVGDE